MSKLLQLFGQHDTAKIESERSRMLANPSSFLDRIHLPIMPHGTPNEHRRHWLDCQTADTMRCMADWRQIQARIRKAKTSADPSSKLSELYQRTHDAMVAWELGTLEEKAERTEGAVKWYTIAAQRFRRSDWKKKAEEALSRLGFPLPATEAETSEPPFENAEPAASQPEAENIETQDDAAMPAVGEVIEEEPDARRLSQQASATSDAGQMRKKRRRGRRGGRGRRKKGAPSPSLPTQAFAESSPESAERGAHAPETQQRTGQRQEYRSERRSEHRSEHASEQRETHRGSRLEHAVPQLPSERTAHGRAGEPALASRMAQLESMLRRLLSSPLHRVDQLDEAPAGPGVFLLSDSDQVTSYYIESCQTLRIGLGNLVRGNRGRSNRGNYSDIDLKNKLAEHLGINESKVSQYIKDHCVVRWIQLDDDAPHLAHFAIGVLRTPLNLE